ncbi:MAG: BatA domain-containing protein [Pirellula sp.]
MTFLNALLAFGATAFSVPLIIHLLNRSKYLTIDWGAMQFLDASVKVNSRRIQWKQLLLLLIRCLIPVLLALAMARPLIQTWKDTAGSTPMSLAILLDDSLSMQSVNDKQGRIGEKRNRIQQAVSQIQKILEELPAGSDASVILAGKPVEMWAQHQPSELSKRLLSLNDRTESAGRLDLSEAARSAASWLEKSSNPRRHLLLVSDFQASEWKSTQQDLSRDLAKQLTSRNVPIAWSFLNAATPAEAAVKDAARESNVSILSVESIPSQVVPQGKLTISVTLQNDSQEAAQVPMVLMEGLDEVERQSVSIAANSTSTVRFVWSPTKAEDTLIKVFADYDDASPQDHSMTKVVRVREPAKVLIIDGDRKREAMQSESDFVRLALTPFSLLRGEPGDLFTTSVVDAGGWNDAMLKDADGVICCNLPDLNPDQRKSLRAFVERGGGLLFCLGDKVQVDKLNAWESISEGGLGIGAWTTRTAWEGSIKPTSSPAFELSKASLDSLSSARFVARNTLKLDDALTTPPVTSIAYQDDQPFLVSSAIGAGRCFWMSSSCDDDDSNLPSLPVFLPLVQRLMTTAIRWPAGWKETPLGETWIENPSQATKLSVQLPGLTTRELAIEQNKPIDLGTGRLEGVGQAMAGERRLYNGFATSSTDRKQELTRTLLAPEELETLAKSASASVHNDADHWLNQERSNSNGKELWTWFWLGLLALFFAEIFLQQSLSPRSSKAAAPSAPSNAINTTKRGAA